MMFIIHPSDKCGFGRKGSQAVRGFFTRAGQSAGLVGGKRCCSKEVMHFGEPGLTHNGAGWAINGRGKLGWRLALQLSRWKPRHLKTGTAFALWQGKHSGNAVQTTIFVANGGHEQIRAKALRGPGQRRRGAL